MMPRIELEFLLYLQCIFEVIKLINQSLLLKLLSYFVVVINRTRKCVLFCVRVSEIVLFYLLTYLLCCITEKLAVESPDLNDTKRRVNLS